MNLLGPHSETKVRIAKFMYVMVEMAKDMCIMKTALLTHDFISSVFSTETNGGIDI